MKEIKEIAKALAKGDVDAAYEARSRLDPTDEVLEHEAREVVRQAIIAYLKKGLIYKARETESRFKLPKDAVDEAIKQAVLSSFRDGNVKRVEELRRDLPINRTLADELIEFCASWGKPDSIACLQTVLA
ncbi:MAG: hypothetical protein HZA81_00710 [Candidatus Taylorbacteria bacterium]|nr:hypothetical protein [Candidatus Taylorbacteria bacterium]